MIHQLRQLALGLVACPTRDTSLNHQRFLEGWRKFQSQDLEASELTPAVMAGMLLFDPEKLPLLSQEEHRQLAALASTALERYQQRINPNNPVGTALAGSLTDYL